MGTHCCQSETSTVPTIADWGGGYTCPMHPEVVSDSLGNCLYCGMSLEPLHPKDADLAVNRELQHLQRRFWICVPLAAFLLVLTMGPMVLGRATILSGWLQAALATPVVLWGGLPFFQRAWESLAHRSPNMFTLIALGVLTAYGYSLAALCVPQWFPEVFRAHGGELHVYFESAAVIITLALLGQVLELKARRKTGDAIQLLLNLIPPVARVIQDDGQEVDRPVSEIPLGAQIRIRPGESIALDGVVISGHSAVNESMVSGEAIPVEKQSGDRVSGGTLNTTGSLTVCVDRVGEDTMLAQMIRQVQSAARSRAPIQALADQVSGWFVPVVLLIAVLTFIGWYLLGPEPQGVYALVNAIAVLMIACPCSLGLATPMSMMTATGRAATLGVLFKDARAVQALDRVTLIALDKTGTVTQGQPMVTDVECLIKGLSSTELLRWAASLEQASEHPLADAVVRAAKAQTISLSVVEDFESATGQGVCGWVEGRRITIGNPTWLSANGIALVPSRDRVSQYQQVGSTLLWIGVEDQLAGLIAVRDPLKPSSPSAIAQLMAMGIEVILVTGDQPETARVVAAQAGIQRWEAGIPPQGKTRLIQLWQEQGQVVAMAGDGLNDAPALAQADVGIAMAAGSDVAIQSAAVTLVHGDLTAVVRAVRLSRATMRNIRQNLWFAFLYNALGIPLAAGLFYPAFGIVLNPMISALAMSLSSVCVIANALRLNRQG